MYCCFFSSSSSESDSDESDGEVKVDKFGNTIDYVPLHNDDDSNSETETDKNEICDIDTKVKHSYSTNSCDNREEERNSCDNREEERNSCDNREEDRNETKMLEALSKVVIAPNKAGDNETADDCSNTETVISVKDEQEEQLR